MSAREVQVQKNIRNRTVLSGGQRKTSMPELGNGRITTRGMHATLPEYRLTLKKNTNLTRSSVLQREGILN